MGLPLPLSFSQGKWGVLAADPPTLTLALPPLSSVVRVYSRHGIHTLAKNALFDPMRSPGFLPKPGSEAISLEGRSTLAVGSFVQLFIRSLNVDVLLTPGGPLGQARD